VVASLFLELKINNLFEQYKPKLLYLLVEPPPATLSKGRPAHTFRRGVLDEGEEEVKSH